MGKKNELVSATASDLAELENLEWSPVELDTEDLRLPGLHLITASSDLAKEGTISPGTFVNMATKEEFGKEVIVVPFHFGKVWRRYNADDKLVSVVKANTRYDFKWNRAEDPDGYRNEYCYDFYVLIPGQDMPFTVSFKATNADEGRSLAGLMAQNGTIPCRKAVKLVTKTKQNSKGNRKWMAKDFAIERDSTKNEILKCNEWQPMAVEYHNANMFTQQIKEPVGVDPEQPALF